MKIDICFITSTPHLDAYASLGNRQLSLAHMLLKDDTYAQYYTNTQKYTIMDNSAFEFEQEGRGVPQDMVLKAAELSRPDEMCAIDILFNGPDTVDSVKDFCNFIKKKNEWLYDDTNFMAIPQGRTESEWLDCYESLVTMDEIDVIGLSKLSVPESFYGNHKDNGNCTEGRIKCIDFLVEHKMTPNMFGKKTHLLGSDNEGIKELSYYYDKEYSWIRSNDTSMPFVYGYHGKKIEEDLVDDIVLDKLDFDKQLTMEEVRVVDNNFIAWRTINVN